MAGTYYFYILTSERNGTLYVGVTNDLVRRVHENRSGVADGFTKRHNVKMLVWFEQTDDIASALLREKQLKKWYRSWKLDLIEKTNPDWKDLYEEII